MISDETFSIVAFLSIIASSITLWLLFSRGRRMRRFLRSLTPEQLETLQSILREEEERSSPKAEEPRDDK